MCQELGGVEGAAVVKPQVRYHAIAGKCSCAHLQFIHRQRIADSFGQNFNAKDFLVFGTTVHVFHVGQCRCRSVGHVLGGDAAHRDGELLPLWILGMEAKGEFAIATL